MPGERREIDSPHLVVLPFADKGHITPTLILANRLAILHGISITVVLVSREQVEPLAAANPRLQFAALDTERGSQSKAAALTAMLDTWKGSDSPPVAILVDIISMWSAEPLRRSGIPKLVLYTASCSNLCVMLGLRAPPPAIAIDETRAAWQPGLNDPEMPDFDSRDWTIDVAGARAVLVNSCQELETSAMAELIRAQPRIPPVLPIGPLIAVDPDPKTASSFTSCKQWLDEQPPSSVIFVSFGSRTFLCDEQVGELASGLERSNQPFLWVLPIPPWYDAGSTTSKEYLERVLPQGFQSRKQAGIIVCGWAPQKMILKHSSLLGFVTHCGWNSVLECLSLDAKPMLCWPFAADQPENARFVVEEIDAGMELERDSSGVVRSCEIEAKIKALAAKPKAVRRDWGRCLSKALEMGGSSTHNVSKVAELLYELSAGKPL